MGQLLQGKSCNNAARKLFMELTVSYLYAASSDLKDLDSNTKPRSDILRYYRSTSFFRPILLSEPEFVNVYGAKESIPSYRFRRPM